MMRSVVTALFAFTIASPSIAVAHDGLERSVPGKDEHLAVAPRSLRLTFTSAPRLAFVRLQLFAPGDWAVPLGELRIDSIRAVVAEIVGPLVGGVYTVAWQITGADGHPVRGRFSFTIAPGAAGLGVSHADHAGGSTAATTEPPPAHHDPISMPTGGAFDAESPGYVAVRLATFSSLLALLGVVAFRCVVLPLMGTRAPADRAALLRQAALPRSAALGAVAATMLVVAVIARLFAQSYALHGARDALDLSLIRGMLRQTTWGWAWLAQAAAAGAALAAFLHARHAERVRAAWPIAAAAGCVLAFTLPFSGHAASAPTLVPVAIAADGLHVLGAGGWLGGLLAVLTVGIPSAMALPQSERGPAFADVVHAFSPTALLFAGLVALTGVFAGWLHIGSIPALWTTAYGRTLLWKLGMLSVVALTGVYNWRRVRPALGDEAGAVRLRRSASIELAVAVVVIAITAVLVATPPPPEAMGITQ